MRLAEIKVPPPTSYFLNISETPWFSEKALKWVGLLFSYKLRLAEKKAPPPGAFYEKPLYLIFVKISKILLKIKTSLERISYYNRDFDPNFGRPYNLRDFVKILSLYWSKFWPKFSIFRPNFYILNKMFKILTKNFESLTFDILIKMFKISIKMMEIYYKVSSAAAFR